MRSGPLSCRRMGGMKGGSMTFLLIGLLAVLIFLSATSSDGFGSNRH
jgi:hypothetical protein